MNPKIYLVLLLCILQIRINAQAPILYIHLVSHNEPNDNLDASPGINYTKAKSKVLQMADIVNTKNAKWNLQTCDGFVLGALNFDNGGSSNSDVFEILANPPYQDNVQIDPRSKNKDGRNIADLWYLLDSCGANPTNHLGGCIYTTTNPGVQPIDWLQYRNPVIGNIYGNSWQCSLLTGAGSYPAHSNDLNDFGLFKPDTTTNFYHHNPSKNLWCIGTGCAPLLDSNSNEQAIIDLIQGQVDSIQNGLWPASKFYVTRIMTNQREYGPLFFQKLSNVIDSLNLIPSTKLKWATIGESVTAFQNWQVSSGLDHSQWRCGQTSALGFYEENSLDEINIYPNPASMEISILMANYSKPISIVFYNSLGQSVQQNYIYGTQKIDISNLAEGLYHLIISADENRIKSHTLIVSK